MTNYLTRSLVCFISLICLACSGGGDEIIKKSLTVSEVDFEATPVGETRILTIDSPAAWFATTSDKSWITVSPQTGEAGISEVAVTIKANDTKDSRTGNITFKTNEESISLKVTQNWSYYFYLPCEQYTIGYGGGEVIMANLSAGDFTLNLDKETKKWISLRGNVLEIAFNDNPEGREATLNITDKKLGENYTVQFIQEPYTGDGKALELQELIIDDYSCPTDSFTEMNDFMYSVDMDAPSDNKKVKINFRGEGVQWITIGSNEQKIYSGDLVEIENFAANNTLRIYTHNKYTTKVGKNELIISGLPLMIINTKGTIKDEPKVDCTIHLFDPKARTDFGDKKNLVVFESEAGIEFRGAGAQRYPKKPYNFKLKDATGEKREAELLNIRNDNSWILDAMYLDMARMRNRVCFDLWNTFNKPYYVDEKPKAMSGTRGHYVEVLINGEYMGLFILSDRIDRKQYQIEQHVGKEGGYIYKAKGWSQACYLQSHPTVSNSSFYWSGADIEQEYPDADDGKPNFQHMANFIDFVSSTSKADFSKNFNLRVDENSVIDTFIFLNLILGYDNAGRNTFWILRDVSTSSKMMHGLWDLDGTLGRDWNRVKVSANSGWYYGNSANPGGTNYFKLFKRIIDGDVDGLQQKIYNRWMALKDNELSPAKFNELVDYYAEQQIASGARDREIARWRALETADATTGTNGWVHYSGNYGNVEEEVTYMKQWYKDRVTKLNSLLQSFNKK